MEELERKWDLTATSSKATAPTNYFVREYAVNSIRTFDGMMPSMPFELTSQTSHALTPHEMMKRGHVLNGYVITSKSADPVTQKTIIGRDIADFREDNAKLYHRCHGKPDDNEELIANFTVEVAMKVTLVGLKTSNEILRLIIHGIGEPIEMEIEHNRYITYFCSDVRAQFPQFRIYHTSKDSVELMKEYLSLVYEHAMPHLKHVTEYDYAGWQDDCRYHSGTDADCRSSRCLPNVSNKSFASYETAKEKYIALPLAGNYCIRTSPDPDSSSNVNPVVSINQTAVAPYADCGIFGISAINGFGTIKNLGSVLNVMLAHEPIHLVYPCATWFPDFESALSWAWKDYSTRFFMRYNASAFYPLTPNEQLRLGDIFTDDNFAYLEKHCQSNDVQMTLLQYGLLH